VTFLDRLSKAMQMDEISQEIGLDLQTESLLVRAEQLARLETDKLVDKVKGTIDITSCRCHCHVANVFSFVLCFFVVQIVCAYRTSQYLYSSYTTLPRIRRERSFHELPCLKEVSPRREQSALERNFTESSNILFVDIHFVSPSWSILNVERERGVLFIPLFLPRFSDILYG